MLLGDCHGDFTKLYHFAERMSLGANDTIIVLGDMGLFWRKDKVDAKVNIEDFESRFDFNLYFIDGNHENHILLGQLEEDENGMGYISEHIRYLKRGRTYNINGKKFLAIGGADSIDQFRRIKNLSWWAEETISNEDIERIESGYYDYVLSHCCPTSIFNKHKLTLCASNPYKLDDEECFHWSENKLEQVKSFIDFGHWYFAHYHADVQVEDNFTCLYNFFEELV